MAGPRSSFGERKSDPNGVGPYEFGLSEFGPDPLQAGDKAVLNLRDFQNGRFVTLSPAGYDSIQVENLSTDVTIRAVTNEVGSFRIPPSSVRSLTSQGIYRVEVENLESSTALSAEDLVVELLKEPYDANDQARGERKRGPISQVVEKFTGINPNGI